MRHLTLLCLIVLLVGVALARHNPKKGHGRGLRPVKDEKETNAIKVRSAHHAKNDVKKGLKKRVIHHKHGHHGSGLRKSPARKDMPFKRWMKMTKHLRTLKDKIHTIKDTLKKNFLRKRKREHLKKKDHKRTAIHKKMHAGNHKRNALHKKKKAANHKRNAGHHKRNAGHHKRNAGHHKRNAGHHKRNAGHHKRNAANHKRNAMHKKKKNKTYKRSSAMQSLLKELQDIKARRSGNH